MWLLELLAVRELPDDAHTICLWFETAERLHRLSADLKFIDGATLDERVVLGVDETAALDVQAALFASRIDSYLSIRRPRGIRDFIRKMGNIGYYVDFALEARR